MTRIRHTNAFTIIELLIMTLLLAVIGAVFWVQFNNVKVASRDETRRMAINSIYYNLEEIYYAKNKHYPKTVNADNLTAMDKALFTDPDGYKIGDASSDYRYEPVDCNRDDECNGYTLRADLEAEDDFVKQNREHETN